MGVFRVKHPQIWELHISYPQKGFACTRPRLLNNCARKLVRGYGLYWAVSLLIFVKLEWRSILDIREIFKTRKRKKNKQSKVMASLFHTRRTTCEKLHLNTTPVSAWERAKPDAAKVNGKNINLRLTEHCNFSTFYALVNLFQAGATSCKKPRVNTSGFR